MRFGRLCDIIWTLRMIRCAGNIRQSWRHTRVTKLNYPWTGWKKQRKILSYKNSKEDGVVSANQKWSYLQSELRPWHTFQTVLSWSTLFAILFLFFNRAPYLEQWFCPDSKMEVSTSEFQEWKGQKYHLCMSWLDFQYAHSGTCMHSIHNPTATLIQDAIHVLSLSHIYI